MRKILFLLLYGGICCGSWVCGAAIEGLSDAQWAVLKQGKDVVLEEKVEGAPWPRIKVYRLAQTSPEDLMAVFFDYNTASEYTPDLLESKISHRLSPTTMEVDYCVSVPFLPDEHYTVRNVLSRVPPDGYRVDWKLLKATTTKESEGFLQVEPHEGNALLCYDNFVIPGSKMAGLLQKMAVSRLRSTVSALVDYAEKKKAEDSEEFQKQKEALASALSGDSAEK